MEPRREVVDRIQVVIGALELTLLDDGDAGVHRAEFVLWGRRSEVSMDHGDCFQKW